MSSLTQQADRAAWELTTSAQSGDRDAYAALYQMYHSLIRAYVLRRVGNWHVAEDITSETFLRAWRRIDSVTDQGQELERWLVTIARNIIFDRAKSKSFQLEVSVPLVNDAPEDVRSIERLVIDKELAVQLQRALAQLRPDQRRCVELRFLQEMSVTETADAMGRREGAVKALQHRAIRRLAQLFPQEAA